MGWVIIVFSFCGFIFERDVLEIDETYQVISTLYITIPS